MVDTTAISIVGIVASGGFGVLVSGLASRSASKRLRVQLDRERSAADLAELRAVLDEASESIRRATWESQSIVQNYRGMPSLWLSLLGFRRRSSIETARQNGAEMIRRCTETAREAALVSGKIALRLGRSHPVYSAYEEAMNAFRDMVRDAGPIIDDVEGWFFKRQSKQDALDKVFHDGEVRFGEKRRAFIGAAHAVVRSRLEA